MNAARGCASIADPAGNLLFYTNGLAVWDKNHNIMANSYGLNGFGSPQPIVIVKKPASTSIYYIFYSNMSAGIMYSTVDMSLAAGVGSVTALNVQIPNSPLSDKIAAVRHCNGTDIWVVSRDGVYSNGGVNFYSFLVTSSGITNTPVTSPAYSDPLNSYDYSCMKISPNGKKIGVAVYNVNSGSAFEMYDFNATTGVVSNSLALSTGAWDNNNGYGCEFSQDGTKFYGSYNNYFPTNTSIAISQWDLCAGSNVAIQASHYVVAGVNPIGFLYGSMQLGPDGKIYVARNNQDELGVINNPNIAGASCNYNDVGQPIAANAVRYGLPNFVSSYFDTPVVLTPFTHTTSLISCKTTSFTAPPYPVFACPAAGHTLTAISWNFGDPASGNNTVTIANPIHVFSGSGTFTVKLIYTYSCGSDTLISPVTINSANLSFTSTGISCSALGTATAVITGGNAPFSYTWLPTAQTSSVATNLQPGSYTVNIVDNAGNCPSSFTTTFYSSIPYTSTVNNATSIPCNGIGTGTANLIVSGGTGNTNYYWTNGSSVSTAPSPTNLSAGMFTVTATDAITSCSVVQSFTITQPPPLSLSISASSTFACVDAGITFTAVNSGGTGPGYTYTWVAGPQTNTYVITHSLAANYIYTVSSSDSNNCLITSTVQAVFIQPTINVTSATVCPAKIATLTASGANTYSWLPGNVSGGSFIASPTTTSTYSVTGFISGCPSAPVTATVMVLPPPVPVISNGMPVCSQRPLALFSNNNNSYLWSGPASFSSDVQNPVIPTVDVLNSGIYSLTVTASNNCTASAAITISVNQTPVIITTNTIVCFGNPVTLKASGANTYTWSGPGGFSSFLNSPQITSVTTVQNGTYTVAGTALNSCTNVASLVVGTYPLPSPSITASPSVCLNSIIDLKASGGDSYLWNGPNNYVSNAQSAVFNAFTTKYSGIYTLTAYSDKGCSAKTYTNIQVNKLPEGSLVSSSDNRCVPFCSDFSFLSTGDAPVINTNWNVSGSAFYDPSFNYCFQKAGTFNVTGTFTNSNGCSTIYNFALVTHSVPKADFAFIPEDPVANTDDVSFINSSSGDQLNEWNWFFINNNGYTANTKNTSYTFENDGTYPVAMVVTNTWGCADTIVKAITVDSEFYIYVPNAFTPNGDDLNNTFQPKGKGIEKYDFEIYNRWGRKIFETSNFESGWDGTDHGTECQPEVYIWKIVAYNKSGRKKELNGFVTLYR